MIINKTMDRADLELEGAKEIIKDLNELVGYCDSNGLRISSWYGSLQTGGKPMSEKIITFPYGHTIQFLNRGYGYEPLTGTADDERFPWFLYWEITWLAMNIDFRPGQRVLDMGGSSSLFSYYLASKGLDVTTVDLQEELVENANSVAKKSGFSLNNHVQDMRNLELDGQFDHITSVCVYEHIPMFDRVTINERVRDYLKEGGTFSITFDYLNPVVQASINSPEDVRKQFVEPSGLRLRGNSEFVDNGKRYLMSQFYNKDSTIQYRLLQVYKRRYPLGDLFSPRSGNDYTFGALFMEK